MYLNKTHYHITVVSGKVFIEPQMTRSFLSAVTKYNDAIQVLIDRAGAAIVKRGIGITTLTDGDTVKYRSCTKDCMEEL
jgi:hypothetical protein